MPDQRICNYIRTNNHDSMRTSICRNIDVDISVKSGISISKSICISTK